MSTWTARLILANVAMFLVSELAPQLANALVFVPTLILQRPWSLITYMFLHGGLGHLFFNMLGLFFFGPRLEARLGGGPFLRLYFLSGLGGALLSFAFSGSAIIGASGAVFGVQLAYAMLWPRDQIYIWGVIPVEARWLVAIMTALALFGARGGGDGIAHFAHLGGFAGGYLFMRWHARNSGTARFRAKSASVRTPAVDRDAVQRWSEIKGEDLHEVNRAELNRILDKIRESGLASLTAGDREFLERFSRR